MVFAPYNGAYAKQDMVHSHSLPSEIKEYCFSLHCIPPTPALQHFAVAGLDPEDTHWRTVHDFNERDTSVEQPHWSLIGA